MEVLFTMIKINPNIKPINVLGFEYLLTSYADDSTFFVSDINSINEVFSKLSGLRVNKSKCEIAGIGSKNGAIEALCGLQSIYLNNNSLRILGVHYTYNDNLYLEKNFLEVIKKIEKVLAMRRWRNITLAGKITIFKSLAFSKIVFIPYLSYIPNEMIEKIEKIHKDSIWDSKKPKMKHSSMIGDYGGRWFERY